MATTENQDTDGEQGGRQRPRSPNYPTIGFKAALDLAQRLYEHEKRHAMSREVAVKTLGYNSLNGRSKMILSALRKFGLIEPSGNELVRVTEEAQALFVMPPDAPDRPKILESLALRPEIYRALLTEFPGDLPSDQNLRAHLIMKRKFTEDAADVFLAAFRETMAEVPKGASQPPVDQQPQTNSPRASLFDTAFMGWPSQVPPSKPAGTAEPAVDVQLINLGDGVKAELRILGHAEPKHMKKLVRFIQLSLEDQADDA